MRSRLMLLIGLLVAGQVVLAGCGDSTDPAGPDDAAVRPVGAIEVVAGANQSVGPGEVVPISPVVRVTSDRGRPIQGAVVTLVSEAGLGALDATALTTDSKGEATLPRWVAPLVAGEFAVNATASTHASAAGVSVRIAARVSDVPISIVSQAIGIAGGMVKVDSPLSPLAGLTITVPAGAFTASTTISVTSHPAPVAPAGLKVASPLLEISTGGLTPDSLIMIRIPATAGDGVPRTFLRGPDGGLTPVSTLTSDGSSVTVLLRRFATQADASPGSALSSGEQAIQVSGIVVYGWAVPTSGVYTSGFEIGRNDHGVENFGSFWEHQGYCSGSVILAGWWFLNRSSTARDQFRPLLSTLTQEDWNLTHQLNPVIRLLTALQRDWGPTVKTIGYRKTLFGQADRDVWNNVFAQLYFSRAPVYLSVSTWGWIGPTHALLAYKVDLDEKRIYVMDPEGPTTERYIEWNVDKQEFYAFPSGGEYYTEFAEATDFFREHGDEIEARIDQYFADGLRSKFPTVEGKVTLMSGEVIEVRGDITPITVQSRDHELRFTATNLDSGDLDWVSLSGKEIDHGYKFLRTNTYEVSFPLATGETKLGMLFRKKPEAPTGVEWYDAKLLVITRELPVSTVASVTIMPTAASIALGGTQQFVATLRDENGVSLSGPTVTWSSSDSSTVSISSSTGLANGVAQGTAVITATSEGKAGTATVTVTSASTLVSSVSIVPSSVSITVGGSLQLTATPRDSAGHAIPGMVVSWASSNAVASVNSEGLVSGVAVGAATITATAGGTSGTAIVAVMEPPDCPSPVIVDRNIDSTTIWVSGPVGCVHYQVTRDISVRAPLEVQAGTTVAFAQYAGITVSSEGSLMAVGTETSRIRFVGEQVVPGYWNGLRIWTNSAANELTYVEVGYGGRNSTSINANVQVTGTLKLTHSILEQGGHLGLYVSSSATLPGFASNTFRNNGASGIRVPAHLVGSLDTSSTYDAGNGTDFIEVDAWTIAEAQTWHITAVPLRIKNDVSVRAALTIMPGVTLLFAQYAGITVSSEGSLTAVGTETSRIRFVGEQAVPGYWDGLRIWTNSAANELTYVEVAYGGRGSTSSSANVQVASRGLLRLTNSIIRDSLGWGLYIDSSSTVTPSPIMEAGNVFSNNARGDIGP